jgi:hypothetical protein
MKYVVIVAGLVVCLGLQARADEYTDYLEALEAEFTLSKDEGPVRVTVRPRLMERLFAEAVAKALEEDKSRKDIVAEWKPEMAKLREDGYVFEIEFLLLNQNLDAGIEIEFHGDWRNEIVLFNNLGVTSRLYRTTGTDTAKLDFMYPERTTLCYFNTCDEAKQPLIATGVQSLKLQIGKFCEELPEIEFSWAVPLWYGDVARPPALSGIFGGRHLRTLWPYKEQVYHAPVRSPSRLARDADTPAAETAAKADAAKPATKPPPPPAGW